MKKLLLILLCLPFIGFGQACQYGSAIDASEICDFYRGNNFSTYKNADIALNKILDVTGMSKRFSLMECNDINNCLATSYRGVRYILYDREFMDAIATRTNSWSNLSILAHEIGHHVNGHSLDLIVYASEAAEAPTLAESRQMELEADEYSGFVMYKLGASLLQAQEAVRLICTNNDDTYSTHPKLDKRLAAIERGYNNAKSQVFNKKSSEKNTSNNKKEIEKTVSLDNNFQLLESSLGKKDFILELLFNNELLPADKKRGPNGTKPITESTSLMKLYIKKKQIKAWEELNGTVEFLKFFRGKWKEEDRDKPYTWEWNEDENKLIITLIRNYYRRVIEINDRGVSYLQQNYDPYKRPKTLGDIQQELNGEIINIIEVN